MIDVAISWEKGEKTLRLRTRHSQPYEKVFLNWNKDTVEDGIIYKHLTELSNGEINLEASGELLTDSEVFLQNKIVKQTPLTSRNNNKPRNNNNNNNRSKKRY